MPQEIRLAFVGQSIYFEYMVLEQPTAGVIPAFVDFDSEMRATNLRAALEQFEPDVVVCFRPEFVPEGALRDIDAVTIGFLSEPLPRPDRPSHPDLEKRLGYLRAADPYNFDRTIVYDPHIAATVDPILPVWRALPLPVGDRLFGEVRPSTGPPKLLFTGRSTEHRDAILNPIKHHYDVVHLAHGVTDQHLEAFMDECNVGLNIHNEPYPNYENRVSVYLAHGILVLTEKLSPTWGLQHGIDYVEINGDWDAVDLMGALHRTPAAFDHVRTSGRIKAERFRASRVWPALAREAIADVAAYGSPRREPGTPRPRAPLLS